MDEFLKAKYSNKEITVNSFNEITSLESTAEEHNTAISMLLNLTALTSAQILVQL